MSESQFSYIIMTVLTCIRQFHDHTFPIAWYYGGNSILLSKYLNGHYRMVGKFREYKCFAKQAKIWVSEILRVYNFCGR